MNKSELIADVAQKMNGTKKDAEKAVNAFFSITEDVLKNQDNLQIIGFGTFEVKERSARKGRNPQTGEEIDIASSKIPSFKVGKAFKEKVNK